MTTIEQEIEVYKAIEQLVEKSRELARFLRISSYKSEAFSVSFEWFLSQSLQTSVCFAPPFDSHALRKELLLFMQSFARARIQQNIHKIAELMDSLNEQVTKSKE